jgi:hypothetical protein
MVLDVDAENKRISLGMKQLQDDPWPSDLRAVRAGSRARRQGGRVQDKGVVVDLGDDIEGFVPARIRASRTPRSSRSITGGDPVSLRILRRSEPTHRARGDRDAEAEVAGRDRSSARRSGSGEGCSRGRGEGRRGGRRRGRARGGQEAGLPSGKRDARRRQAGRSEGGCGSRRRGRGRRLAACARSPGSASR